MRAPQVCETYPVSIFMAGDIDEAKRVCRDYCDETGFCVTVTATDYIYTGGQEAGFVVGIINYPRFPATSSVLASKAEVLASRLRLELGQESYTIQRPEATVFFSWRDGE